MRIGFLVIEFPAPSETFILDQITGVIDRGHEVEIVARQRGRTTSVDPAIEAYGLLDRTVFASHPGSSVGRRATALARAGRVAVGRPTHMGDVVKSVRAASGAEVLALDAALRGRPRHDVMHAHFGPNGVLGVHLRRLGAIDCPIVTTYHGLDLTRLVQERGMAYYDDLLAEGDFHMPVSERFRRVLLDAGAPPARTCVHRMGVPVDRFDVVPRRRADDEPLRLVSVARFVAKKGLADGIAAVADAVDAGHHVHYDIVGDGPLRDQLRAFVADYAKSDCVTFHGWQSRAEVVSLMQRADALVAPSVTAPDGDEEGVPVTIMEAIASGLPVLATRHGGIPEIVDHGVNGYLVDEGDVAAMAERIGALASSPETRAQMGRAARACAEADWDVSALNDRLVACYEALADA